MRYIFFELVTESKEEELLFLFFVTLPVLCTLYYIFKSTTIPLWKVLNERNFYNRRRNLRRLYHILKFDALFQLMWSTGFSISKIQIVGVPNNVSAMLFQTTLRYILYSIFYAWYHNNKKPFCLKYYIAKLQNKILKFLYHKTDMNRPKTATNLGISTHIQSMLFVPLLC